MGELSDGGGYVFIGEAYIDRYYVAAERLHEIQEFHQPEELDAIYRIITFQPTSRCLLDKSILPILQKQKVVLFGAGIVGQSYYRQSFETGLQLEAWIASRPKEGLPVKTLESLDGLEYDVIVTQELFDCAQAALCDFMEREGRPGEATLREKIRCGICGHAMMRKPTKNPYYFCRTSRMTDTFSCTTERIPELDIMEALLSGLRAQAAIAVEWDRVLEERHSRRGIDAAAIHKSIAALKEELSRQETQAQELYEAFVLGEVNRSEYLEARAAAHIRHREVEDRIAELETELDIDDKNGALRNRFVTSFQKYTEVEEITSEIVTDVLNTIFVYPDGRLEIIWNYREEYEKLLLSLHGDEQ